MLSEEHIIWQSEIGSRIWKMENDKSDYDRFCCVTFPAKRILEGITFPKSERSTIISDGDVIDIIYMEAGHVVNLLLKGNINMILAITSPIVYYGDERFNLLKRIVLENLSTASYPSIYGMAKRQFLEYRKKGNEKFLRASICILRFGCALMRGKIIYEPVTDNIPSPKDGIAIYSREIKRLSAAFCESTLSPHVDETPFRKWLYDTRVMYL